MINTIYRKTLEFGKVAYNGKRRSNMAEVTIELREEDEGILLSICGGIWNHIHTDYLTCGQCLDTIRRYVRNDTFKRIYSMWENHHLKIISADMVDEVYSICGVERKAVA